MAITPELLAQLPDDIRAQVEAMQQENAKLSNDVQALSKSNTEKQYTIDLGRVLSECPDVDVAALGVKPYDELLAVAKKLQDRFNAVKSSIQTPAPAGSPAPAGAPAAEGQPSTGSLKGIPAASGGNIDAVQEAAKRAAQEKAAAAHAERVKGGNVSGLLDEKMPGLLAAHGIR